MNICSFGGGVQSTAMAVLAVQDNINIDAFVFCDTGFEQSIVFEFLEKYTLPMLEEAGIPFYIAKAEHYAGKYFANMDLPPFFNFDNEEVGRQPAFCSSNWKRDIFKRFCNDKFKLKAYNVLMGFSTDEIKRAARIKLSKKWNYVFPLLDLGLNRNECVKLVHETFNTDPPRSSCYFCPNHTREEWRHVMASNDSEKTIEFDNGLREIGRFLTHDCQPIQDVDFSDSNESIFSRFCAGGCFL